MAQRIRTLTTLPENPSLIIRTYMAAPQLSATAILEVIQHPCLTLVGKRHTLSTNIYVRAKHLHKINKTIPQFLHSNPLLALSIEIKINHYVAHTRKACSCAPEISALRQEDLELHASKDYTTLKKKGVPSLKRHSLKKYQARYGST